jgi:hypothetical protein
MQFISFLGINTILQCKTDEKYKTRFGGTEERAM